MKRTRAFVLAVVVSAGAAYPFVPSATEQVTKPASVKSAAFDRSSTRPAIAVDAAVPVVMLVDLATGQTLYEREVTRRFVPASVTKVMTAYTAFGLIAAGKLSPETVVTISKETADEWYAQGSSMFLRAGDKVTVAQLLTGITTVSANDGSVVMAQITVGSVPEWTALMNKNAAELGMKNTHFGTANGWPDEGKTFTTAADLAVLAEALTTRHPELYKRFFGHRGMTYNGIAQANHDPVTGVVEGADGIKTGFTRQSGYNFVGSAERNGRRLVVVVGAAPTIPLRNAVSRDLLRWGFDAFETQEVLPANRVVGEAQVQNGSARSVPLRTGGNVLVAVPRGDTPKVKLSVLYRGPVEAPIAAGQAIAHLRVEVAGQKPHDIPLLAAEAVEEANAFQRLINGVTGFFA